MHRHIYTFFILALVALLPFTASAQLRFLNKDRPSNVPERGFVLQVSGGMAAVKSDICKGWGCNNFGPQVSMGVLYKMSPWFGVSGSIGYARLGAQESNPRHPRNISFQTDVIEVTGSAVFNLADSYRGSGNYRSSQKRFIVPYLTAGLGFIYYNPTSYPGQGKLNEAQTKYEPARNYPAIAAVIPFGGGLRFRFTDALSVAPELIYHVTSSDYLDNDGRNLGRNLIYKDHYGVASVKIMYTPTVANRLFSR
ncbi:outer membrane beta-barrel protein [Pontibacter sp. 172403-2]|uniref:outer membrane beta-barrel protein n=1 Tax=Pontibacter rufus TaxID=2791028 RepID=UPI0018AFAB47|nr:outer membrane beta-barrel protein [Pontibacter sp. 172403-2]MBF9254164.1 outer membrane beta-barrel protein [Pontibacter sp. 172403-2]